MKIVSSSLLTALLMLAVADVLPAADPGAQPHVVMLVAEREYQTDQSLDRFAKQRLADSYRTTMVLADPVDRNRLVGIEAVSEADVLLVSVRRRALPATQLDIIRRYVGQGKPVIGIRTANHAFSLRNQEPPQGRAVWSDWDQQVFGGNYTNHYGNQLKATVNVEPSKAVDPSLVRDLNDRPFVAGGSLYKVSPLDAQAVPFLFGRVDGNPPEPVAWTYRRRDGGKSFYTSLGHADDFRGDHLPQLLVNAIEWSLK